MQLVDQLVNLVALVQYQIALILEIVVLVEVSGQLLCDLSTGVPVGALDGVGGSTVGGNT